MGSTDMILFIVSLVLHVILITLAGVFRRLNDLYKVKPVPFRVTTATAVSVVEKRRKRSMGYYLCWLFCDSNEDKLYTDYTVGYDTESEAKKYLGDSKRVVMDIERDAPNFSVDPETVVTTVMKKDRRKICVAFIILIILLETICITTLVVRNGGM